MTNTTEKRAILLFTRAPGNESKALAQAHLGHALHTALVVNALRAAANSGDADIVIAVDGDAGRRVRRLVERLLSGGRVVHEVRQRGANFNDRFVGALEESAALGYDRIVAIGSDTPTLAAADIEAALASRTTTIGPSTDGGFYLIGLAKQDISLLRDLPWQQPTLGAALLERFAVAHLLPVRTDLDDAAQAAACWSTLSRLVRAIVGIDLGEHERRQAFPHHQISDHPQTPTLTRAPHRGPPTAVTESI